MMIESYEHYRALISSMALSVGEQRDVTWFGKSRVVGAARSPSGRIELFIAGPQLEPTNPKVAEILEYREWAGKYGPFSASRIPLPHGEHFDVEAAFLITELLERDAQDDPVGGFARTEPLIALALERHGVGDLALLGLIGELLVLHAITLAAPMSTPAVIESWYGFDRSARDLQLPGTGVEIKATTRLESRHPVTLGEVEPGHSVMGLAESALFLCSLGLVWRDGREGDLSVVDLVEALCQRLRDSGGDVEGFLDRVRSYGGVDGYDHLIDQDKPRFQRTLSMRFARLYDLRDERIHLPTSDALGKFEHVVPDSVTFDIVLPPGDGISDLYVDTLPAVGQALARRAGLATH